MIRILRDDLTLQAVMENASDVMVSERLNDIGALSFSIPYSDAKRKLIRPFAYVEIADAKGNREDIYRILPATKTSSISGGMLTIECEHVMATLLDDVLPGWHQHGGMGTYTDEVLEYILAQQRVKNWVLGDCDFIAQYEYGWQHEKCLTALQMVANTFENYMWRYDVRGYPWTLSLKVIDTTKKPDFRIAYRYNMTEITKTVDPTSLITRMYCYGYGEGINQQDITAVNNGLPYLDAPPAVMDMYGTKCGYYIDRSIEDAETLRAAGQAALNMVMVPLVTYTVTAADLFEATGNPLDRPAAGKITRVFDEDEEITTYITEVTREVGRENTAVVSLSSRPHDVADVIANIADRQRIEQAYAQGATQLYAQTIQDNATSSRPLKLEFYAPQELRMINAVQVKIRLSRFRAYSQATSSGGGAVETSENGGGGIETTSTDSEKSRTSSSGGSDTVTSSQSSGSLTTSQSVGFSNSRTGTTDGHDHTYNTPASHTHIMPAHAHSVSTPSHTHSMTIPAHAHTVEIPAHKHSFSIPAHAHQITPGIFEYGGSSGATVSVNGTFVGAIGVNAEMDITEYLVGSNGSIPRGQWMSIEVAPNDLAYITINMYFQGFVQSRGGGNY